MSILLSSIGKIITTYIGIPVLIAGLAGDILNIIVFLSLKTFRQNSCSFYLTIMSILNIGQLFSGLFPRIMTTLYGVDGTQSSLFYCKFRPCLFQFCTSSSLICFSLATFDQYCSTCSRPRWQQWCNIKLAKRLVIINITIWIIQGIPFLILFEHIPSSIPNQVSCTSTNYIFNQYRAYVVVLLFLGLIPIIISTTFGIMAYRNVRRLTFRAIPIIRRELDKQLTNMVLVQVVINFLTLFPHTIINTLLTTPTLMSNTVVQTILQFVVTITLLIYYTYFASPFYIYICASERFRKQLVYVLFRIHFNRWRQPTILINQVRPEI